MGAWRRTSAVGSVIVALHQYWRSAAAVVVSLSGWFPTIHAVLILVVPNMHKAAGNVPGSGAITVVRTIFGALALVGLYLTYVGWVAKPGQSPSSEPTARQDRLYATGS